MASSPGSSGGTSQQSPPSPADAFAAAFERELLADFTDWQTNPSDWVRHRLNEHVWSKQDEILAALVAHRRVAVQSCHGVGKSHIASRIVAWWLDSHPDDEVFVVTTAPTAAQVRAVLWRYIRQAHRKGRLPGRVNQTEWYLGDDLVAFGRKPADTDPGAFQGIHARYVLVVIDEACGVPEALWIAADALTTNDGCRMLAIGNPDDPTSHFAKVCSSPLWQVLKISAFDSPNLTDEQVPDSLRDLLISRSWAEEKAAEWGEDSPVYAAKVLGEFPKEAENVVVRPSDVAKCRLDTETPRTPAELLPVVLGVDVGGGGDETVIRERRGMVAGREWRSRTDKPEMVANEILAAIIETGATRVVIDSIGIGWGVVGDLRRLGSLGRHTAMIVPCHVGEAADDPLRFENRRAELWWQVGRVLSEQRAWDLSQMANGDVTVSQLCAPLWSISPTGRIKVEPKDDIRERIGRSPDNADALLMAFWVGGHSGSTFWDALVPAGAVNPAAAA